MRGTGRRPNAPASCQPVAVLQSWSFARRICSRSLRPPGVRQHVLQTSRTVRSPSMMKSKRSGRGRCPISSARWRCQSSALPTSRAARRSAIVPAARRAMRFGTALRAMLHTTSRCRGARLPAATGGARCRRPRRPARQPRVPVQRRCALRVVVRFRMEVRELGVDHRCGDAARLEQFKALETDRRLAGAAGPDDQHTRTIGTELARIAEGLARAFCLVCSGRRFLAPPLRKVTRCARLVVLGEARTSVGCLLPASVGRFGSLISAR